MNPFASLEQVAHRPPPPAVEGYWQAVRLQLDQATGESINVGVLFSFDGGARFRLLGNVSGLRCLYGPEGASNAAFAIDQAREAFVRGVELLPSWNISLGRRLFASGESVDRVIDDLYRRLVPLARHEPSDEERLDLDDHRLGTNKLRRRVRDYIRRRFEAREIPSFWKDEPVRVSSRDGHAMSLDMQIWQDGGMVKGTMATITSVWYTSQWFRQSYLNSAFRSLSDARQVQGHTKAKAGLFLLRPMSDERFTREQLGAIDNEIDALHWGLKRIHVDVNTYDNETTLAEAVLSMT